MLTISSISFIFFIDQSNMTDLFFFCQNTLYRKNSCASWGGPISIMYLKIFVFVLRIFVLWFWKLCSLTRKYETSFHHDMTFCRTRVSVAFFVPVERFRFSSEKKHSRCSSCKTLRALSKKRRRRCGASPSFWKCKKLIELFVRESWRPDVLFEKKNRCVLSCRTCVQIIRTQIHEHGELRGQEIAIDFLAGAAVQSGQNGAVRVHAGHQVGDGHGHFGRYGVAGGVQQAADRGGYDVITGFPFPRAFGPVTGDRAVHQIPVDFAQIVVSDAVPVTLCYRVTSFIFPTIL